MEVQQASDTTFRLYDYGRDKTDPTRKLTIKEAIENITVPFTKPKRVHHNGEALSTPYFSIKPIRNTGTHHYSFPQAQ
ncbi:hypothetical protein FACS1894166_00020 [Bacilli bacterium]|nr:hypothetical protein FACS1894166_00020 [Bacilli bacterium]